MKLSVLTESSTVLSGMGVFIRLPASLAKQYPELSEDKSVPHITVLYIGDVDVKLKPKVLKAIRRVASSYDPIDVWVDGLAYFTNHKGVEVAHSMVEAKTLASLSEDLWDEVLRAGVKVEHKFPDYTPHVTLQYGDKRDYDGGVPSGNFKCTELEIWVDDGDKIGVAKLGRK